MNSSLPDLRHLVGSSEEDGDAAELLAELLDGLMRASTHAEDLNWSQGQSAIDEAYNDLIAIAKKSGWGVQIVAEMRPTNGSEQV